MKILVINSGSSTIKYALFDKGGDVLLAKGMAEKMGIRILPLNMRERSSKSICPITGRLCMPYLKELRSRGSQLSATASFMVEGRARKPTVINDAVIQQFEEKVGKFCPFTANPI